MTRLQDLRKRLARLKRRRQRFRWTTGYSAVLIALLWALAVAFPIDWYFQQSMDFTQRLLLTALVAGAGVWAFFRHTLPWLGQRETELDMALMVEHHERIDSDLVAALQFESPEAPQWGSQQLEAAVIEQVATTGRRLNVMQSLPREQLSRRLKVLVLTLVAWGAVAAICPQYVRAFLHRIALGSVHYPSRTRIDSVAVNDRDPFKAAEEHRALVLYGKNARFQVTCQGELPDGGKVVLIGRQSGRRDTIPLKRVEKPKGQTAAGSGQEEQAVYEGEAVKLVEDFRFQVLVGDAWTDRAELFVTQPPAIELQVQVFRPVYAGGTDAAPEEFPKGTALFSVVEGSKVLVTVHSDKKLHSAVLTLNDEPYALVRRQELGGEDSREVWELNPLGTPLEAIVEGIEYSLNVVDCDKLELDRLYAGTFQLRADLPPTVAASSNTSVVLPAARPRISIAANDDYALGRIWATCEVTRTDSRAKQPPAAARAAVLEIYRYDPDKGAARTDYEDRDWRVDLGRLNVTKGDTVKVTVHAADYRGKRPAEGKKAKRLDAAEPKESASEAVVFEVTDEADFWARMSEGWKQSARDLGTMFQRQLGVGEK